MAGVTTVLGDLTPFALEVKHATDSGGVIRSLADTLATRDLILQLGLLRTQLLNLANDAVGDGVGSDAHETKRLDAEAVDDGVEQTVDGVKKPRRSLEGPLVLQEIGGFLIE